MEGEASSRVFLVAMLDDNRAREYAGACRRCVRQLEDRRLAKPIDFRRWALVHHPDKGGDIRTFQQVSDCMDMVHRDSCMDRVMMQQRHGGAGASSGSLGGTEALFAALYQSAATSEIESLGVDGTRAWRSHTKYGIRESRWLDKLSLRVGHRRILGIPLRLYREIEVGAWGNARARKLELVSLGANWGVPRTGGRAILNVSSTSKCNFNHFDSFLRPMTWDLSVRARCVPGLSLDAGLMVDHPSSIAWSKWRSVRVTGFKFGFTIEAADAVITKCKFKAALAGRTLVHRTTKSEDAPAPPPPQASSQPKAATGDADSQGGGDSQQGGMQATSGGAST